jgi:putative aldouronate transport system permease protein
MKIGASDLAFKWLSYGITGVFTLLTIYPLLLTLSASFTDESTVIQNGFALIPEKFSLETYKFLFDSGRNWIIRSYMVTIFVTVAGTIGSMIVTSMLAYALSYKKLKFKRALSFYCYFTMLFSAGIVPWYVICVNYYHLSNSLAGLIVPYLLNVWFLFILRSYFDTIPESLMESAKIDGAGDFYIFIRIMIPLSLPGITTVSLFYAIHYWNDWWLSLLFITQDELYPLQFRLYSLLSSVQGLSSEQLASISGKVSIPTETLKTATTMVTIGPIILLYPFVQRYFIKGLMIGAVKG